MGGVGIIVCLSAVVFPDIFILVDYFAECKAVYHVQLLVQSDICGGVNCKLYPGVSENWKFTLSSGTLTLGGDICVWYLYVYISALEFFDKLSVSHSLLLVTLNNEQFMQCSCREWYCKFYLGKFANLSLFSYLLLLIIQERAMTLCDVTYADYIVHVMCMVHGLQLQYWFSVSTYNISQIIWHMFRWHFLLLILLLFVIVNFNFHAFYMLWFTYRYRSYHTMAILLESYVYTYSVYLQMLLTDTSTYLKIYFLAYKLTIYILLHYCLLTIYTLSILFSYIPWVLFHICNLSYSYFVMQFLSHILGVMTWHGRITSWGRHFIAVLYT